MVFLVRERDAKNIEKKKKTDRKKTLRNEEEKKQEQIQGNSNNNKEHLPFYLLYKKTYFAWRHSLKKVVYTITFYLQFLCVTGYLKSGNDILKLNIHKYNNYNMIKIYA